MTIDEKSNKPNKSNQEACQLYIEQEIDEGLKQNKTPYQIAKEVAEWIRKLFEVNIPVETIKSKAYRRQQKSGSSEPKKSNNLINTDTSDPNSLFASNRGGERENAGRPVDLAMKKKREIITPGKMPHAALMIVTGTVMNVQMTG